MTNKTIVISFILLLFFSCDKDSIKVYHDNGNIQKEYFLKDGKLDGVYKEYFSNGKLKLKHNYLNGKLVDTSFYFYKTPVEQIKFQRIWFEEDSIKQIEFYDNGKIQKKGFVNRDFFRKSKWEYYSQNGKLEIIRDFKIIKNKQYLNQEWFLNNVGDTLFDPSHSIKVLIPKDTLVYGAELKGVVILELPIYKNKKVSTKLILPKSKNNFNKDFSNESLIEVDTFYSLHENPKNQKWIPEIVDYNQVVTFVKEFNSSGNHYFRGYLIESYLNEENDLDEVVKDSLHEKVLKIEHKKYFEIPIFIQPDGSVSN